MKHTLRNAQSFFLVGLFFLMVNLGWGQVSITSTGAPYTQNFDSALGTANLTWANNTTVTGWYISSASPLVTSTGTTTSGACLNLGNAGVNALADRALGCLQSGGSNQRFGLRMKNDTGGAITSFTISFTGEQWRSFNAGNLVFEYQTATTVTSLTSGNWTPNASFDFVALKTSTGVALDGNDPTNRTAITGTLTVSVPAGNEIFFRWTRNTNSSPILAIDDLTITANASGSTPPTLTAALGATVDAPFDVTFTDDATWRGAITGITIGGTALTAGYTVSAGKITFTPSASNPAGLLQTSGTKSIVVTATGYSNATVSQAIGAGLPSTLMVSTPLAAPTSSGGVFATMPAVTVKDQYNNAVSGVVVNAAVTSGQSSSWTLGGASQTATTNASGVATFSTLTATNITSPSIPYSTATLTFTPATGTGSVASASFTVPGISPTLTAAVGATVDTPFAITFTDNATWRSAITSITVGGTTLSASAYSTTTAGQITFTPSASALLQSAGSKSIVIVATGYASASLTQSIGVGAPNKLVMNIQPTAPSVNGGVLATQPKVNIVDQYGNATTSTATITATAVQGTWTLGGTTGVAGVNGTSTFSGLTASSLGPISGATITFTSPGLIAVTSTGFNIPAPPPPALTAAIGATVDNQFEITFIDNATWRAAITSITYDGTSVAPGAFDKTQTGKITFTPSVSTALQIAKTAKNIVIVATGYTNATIAQTIGAGAASKLAMNTQPTAPVTNGGVLATQPKVNIVDQYGNLTSSNASITATVGAGSWIIGGLTSVSATSGTATFSGLTSTSVAAVTGATITFTSLGLISVTSNLFNIPAPANLLATDATNVGSSGFTANWNPMIGATGYNLDVSTSPTFTIPGSPTSVTESFESGMPPSYTNGNVTLSTGVWTLTSTSAVQSGSTGVQSGSVSAQLQSATGSALISPAFSYISTVSFYVTSSTSSGAIQVNYSTDGGATWLAATGSPFTGLGTTTTLKTATINSSSNNILLQFKRTAATIYIDDIIINYAPSIPLFVLGYENLSVSGTSQTVASLTPNTTYYYRVRATDGMVSSTNSNVISVQTYADISTADFRSKATGDFNSLATWEYNTGVLSVGNAGWIDATSLPSGNNNITILATHEVALTQNETINSGATITVNGVFNTSTFALQGAGNLTLANGGTLKIKNLDATDAYAAAVGITGTVTLATSSTVELNGAGQQFLEANTFSGLTINNASGVKATGNITVNGILNLASANPNATDGALDMVIEYDTYATVSKTEPDNYNSTLPHNNLDSYVLNLGAAATVIGIGDVTGKVTRNHTFANNTTYAFSNANMTLNFTDGGNASNLPTKITVIATRGSKGLHVDKDVADNGNPAIGGTAVGRLWQILRTGGQAAARFTVRFPYAESELNSNTEANLVTWDHHLDAPAYAGITPHEHGKTNIDVANNFVELANHSLFYLTTEGSTTNTKYWMLSDQITTNNTWLGAANIPEGQSNWDSTSNWTSGVAPTINGHAVIEPVGVAARNPEFVSGSYSFGSIEIKTGAVVDAGAATITLNSGPATAGNVSGSWLNNGTFNAGTSTVVFNAGVDNLATLAGNTNFHNVTVNTGKTLRLEQNAVMGIAGILTVDGVLNATQSENTVLFNGTIDQTVPATSTDNTTAAYHTLELAGAGVKSFEAAPSIQGDFVKSGTSTVTIPTQFNFNGTSAQSIAGFDYNNIDFSNAGTKTFTSNGSLSNAGAITFSGTPGAVDFDGATDNLTFVLKSDASGTARIGNATDWTLSGKVTSERFVPSRRAWRLLTAPIKGTTNTSIFANWQGTNNEGILLWNPNGGGATGLEVGPQSNIFSYNGGWAAVNNTNTTPLFGATQNNAFLVFATGPHGSANITPGADPTTPATATTLRPKGGLITGTVTTTLTANQFQLIGNPYASALDTEALIGSNPDAKIWMLDPTLGSFGGYVTYDGTNWAPITPVAADKNIQSGQAFFVRSTSTLFSIGETHKVISSSNNWFERDNSASTADKIRVLLYKQESGNWKLADGVLSVHSSVGNDAVDAADANKISNFNENIAFRNGATNLAIEYRGMPEAGTQQPLRMTGTTAQPYQLRVRTEGYVNSTLQPYLEDTASGTLTAIPTDGSDLIVSFTGIVATTSTPDNRFRIVYPATLGLDDLSTTTVRVYPNPITDGTFSVVLHDATTPAHYSLVNVMGQEVQSGALEALHNTVAVGSLQQGIYLLQVRQEGKVFTTKLILK